MTMKSPERAVGETILLLILPPILFGITGFLVFGPKEGAIMGLFGYFVGFLLGSARKRMYMRGTFR